MLAVCLSVCLSVCGQDNSKSCGRILTKFSSSTAYKIKVKSIPQCNNPLSGR